MANDLLNIVNKVNNAIRSPKPRLIALSTVLAKQKERIFTQGLAADGSKIGTYSKKYGEKKTELGRNPGYVNLRLTDQMYGDYGLIVSGDEYGFGFQNSFNYVKMIWNTERYDKEIAALSDPEFNLFMDVYAYELNKAI